MIHCDGLRPLTALDLFGVYLEEMLRLGAGPAYLPVFKQVLQQLTTLVATLPPGDC